MKNFITTIQEVLSGRNEAFDATRPNRIKLVRHKDARKEMTIHGRVYNDFSVYEAYKHHREQFLAYQGEQGKPIFNNVDYIVAFLGENGKNSRFIGVYRNKGLTNTHYSAEAQYVYDLEEAEGFELLKEKVIIDWGESALSWHQYYNNIKHVIRIEDNLEDNEGVPRFKSYADVNLPYDKLKLIFDKEPEEWKTALKVVNCIYIITDGTNGKHYIGSTYDKGGMWKRWAGYAQTGHNDNVTLKNILESNPSVLYKWRWAILETLPLNTTEREAIHRENLHKEKLLTREFGYNNN